MDKTFSSIVKTIAPFAETLATALGSPIAGAAVKVIADSLGCGNKPDQIVEAVKSIDTDAILKLKQADQEFKEKMVQFGIDLEKIAADDRDSARKREIATGDWTPRVLAGLIVVCYFIVQYFLLTHVIPAEMGNIVMRSLGVLDTSLGLVLGYYFGSSAGSAEKNKLLADK